MRCYFFGNLLAFVQMGQEHDEAFAHRVALYYSHGNVVRYFDSPVRCHSSDYDNRKSSLRRSDTANTDLKPNNTERRGIEKT